MPFSWEQGGATAGSYTRKELDGFCALVSSFWPHWGQWIGIWDFKLLFCFNNKGWKRMCGRRDGPIPVPRESTQTAPFTCWHYIWWNATFWMHWRWVTATYLPGCFRSWMLITGFLGDMHLSTLCLPLIMMLNCFLSNALGATTPFCLDPGSERTSNLMSLLGANFRL